MTQIIEKVLAGEDGSKSQEAFALETRDADTVSMSQEFIDAREAQAKREAEANLKNNALIFPAPGETIGVRVVEVSDDEAKSVENGIRIVEGADLAKAVAETEKDANLANESSAALAEGESEAEVDTRSLSSGVAQTSHAEGSDHPRF